MFYLESIISEMYIFVLNTRTIMDWTVNAYNLLIYVALLCIECVLFWQYTYISLFWQYTYMHRMCAIFLPLNHYRIYTGLSGSELFKECQFGLQ